MGKTINGQFERIVNIIEAKYLSKLPVQDKEDFRQEVEITILEASQNNSEMSEGFVYRIVQRTAIDFLKTLPPKTEDITDASVIRKYDKQHSYVPDDNTRLDSEKAVHLVNRLPQPYRYILLESFGIDRESSATDETMANVLNKPVYWIIRKRKRGLSLLKSIMEKKA